MSARNGKVFICRQWLSVRLLKEAAWPRKVANRFSAEEIKFVLSYKGKHKDGQLAFLLTFKRPISYNHYRKLRKDYERGAKDPTSA